MVENRLEFGNHKKKYTLHLLKLPWLGALQAIPVPRAPVPVSACSATNSTETKLQYRTTAEILRTGVVAESGGTGIATPRGPGSRRAGQEALGAERVAVAYVSVTSRPGPAQTGAHHAPAHAHTGFLDRGSARHGRRARGRHHARAERRATSGGGRHRACRPRGHHAGGSSCSVRHAKARRVAVVHRDEQRARHVCAPRAGVRRHV